MSTDGPEAVKETSVTDSPPPKEYLVKPSPVPRSLAIILIVMTAISFGYIVYAQVDKGSTARAFNAKIQEQVDANKVLLERLQLQQDYVEANQERLQLLIASVLSAKTQQDVENALKKFLSDSEKARQAERRREQQQNKTSSSPSSSSMRSPSPSPNPSPSPSRSPKPTQTLTPTKTPGSPSPTPLLTCLDTPFGKLCV